jgi:tRNA A-37 threonylcarbamoyl transferase component Bud32
LNYFGSGPSIRNPEYDFYKIEKKYRLSKYHFVVTLEENEITIKYLVNKVDLERANKKINFDSFSYQPLQLGDKITAGTLKFIYTNGSTVGCFLESSHRVLLADDVMEKRKKYQAFLCSSCIEKQEELQAGEWEEKIRHERYNIIKRIGGGAFHGVYMGVEKETKKKIIIKTFKHSNEESNSQTQNELRKTNDLRHTYILNYNEIISLGQSKYGLVYDFVKGGDLQSYINSHQYVESRVACQIIIQLLDALKFAHKKNIIHHDIKPSNILLTENVDNFVNKPGSYPIPEIIKLCDFGIADVSNNSAGSPANNAFKGTIPFAAPEQLIPHRKEPSIDLYAVGVTFYYMISKNYPYNNIDDIIKIEKEILSDVRIPIEKRTPDQQVIPQKLADIINKSVKRKIEDRYKSALEFREDLDLFFKSYYQETETSGGK